MNINEAKEIIDKHNSKKCFCYSLVFEKTKCSEAKTFLEGYESRQSEIDFLISNVAF